MTSDNNPSDDASSKEGYQDPIAQLVIKTVQDEFKRTRTLFLEAWQHITEDLSERFFPGALKPSPSVGVVSCTLHENADPIQVTRMPHSPSNAFRMTVPIQNGNGNTKHTTLLLGSDNVTLWPATAKLLLPDPNNLQDVQSFSITITSTSQHRTLTSSGMRFFINSTSDEQLSTAYAVLFNAAEWSITTNGDPAPAAVSFSLGGLEESEMLLPEPGRYFGHSLLYELFHYPTKHRFFSLSWEERAASTFTISAKVDLAKQPRLRNTLRTLPSSIFKLNCIPVVNLDKAQHSTTQIDDLPSIPRPQRGPERFPAGRLHSIRSITFKCQNKNTHDAIPIHASTIGGDQQNKPRWKLERSHDPNIKSHIRILNPNPAIQIESLQIESLWTPQDLPAYLFTQAFIDNNTRILCEPQGPSLNGKVRENHTFLLTPLTTVTLPPRDPAPFPLPTMQRSLSLNLLDTLAPTTAAALLKQELTTFARLDWNVGVEDEAATEKTASEMNRKTSIRNFLAQITEVTLSPKTQRQVTATIKLASESPLDSWYNYPFATVLYHYLSMTLGFGNQLVASFVNSHNKSILTLPMKPTSNE